MNSRLFYIRREALKISSADCFRKEDAMRIALVLVFCALVGFASAADAQTLSLLTVNDIGTPLDMPEIWGSVGRQYVAVSPDKQWIAYTQSDFPPRNVVYLKSLQDGTERLVYFYDQFAEQLKDDPNYNDPRIPYRTVNAINTVAFTPDSREITFEVAILDSALGSTWQFEYDAKTGNFSTVKYSNPVPYIKSYSIDTGEIRDITTGRGWGLVWDPTGRYLFVVRTGMHGS